MPFYFCDCYVLCSFTSVLKSSLVSLVSNQPSNTFFNPKGRQNSILWKKNKCSDRNFEVKLSVLLGNYDRPAKQPTDGPTDQKTRPGSKESYTTGGRSQGAWYGVKKEWIRPFPPPFFSFDDHTSKIIFFILFFLYCHYGNNPKSVKILWLSPVSCPAAKLWAVAQALLPQHLQGQDYPPGGGNETDR